MSITDHIAIAIDFTEPSEIAARAGFRLAEIAGAKKVSLLHATREVVLPAGDQPVLRARLEDLKTRLTDAAKKSMDEMVARFATQVPYEQHIISGRPTTVIAEETQAIGATLLVLGTHARRGLKRVFLGSIAEDLLRGLEIPALVTHVGGDGVPPDVELAGLEHVIVAVDVVSTAEDVVRAAVQLLRERSKTHRVTLHLLHVVESHEKLEELLHRELDEVLGEEDEHMFQDMRDALVQTAEEQLQALRTKFDKESDALQFEIHVEHGDFVDVASALTASIPAQAIAMGTHGRDWAPILDIGSTTSRMIRSADVSVLVVPSHHARRSVPPDSKGD